MLKHSGFSGNYMASGIHPADLYVWRDNYYESDFVQNASASSQFARKWKLRDMAEGATLKGLAKGNLKDLLARSRKFHGAGAKVGNAVFSYNRIGGKKSSQMRRPGGDPGHL